MWLRKVEATYHDKGTSKGQNLEVQGQSKTTGLEQLEQLDLARARSWINFRLESEPAVKPKSGPIKEVVVKIVI